MPDAGRLDIYLPRLFVGVVPLPELIAALLRTLQLCAIPIQVALRPRPIVAALHSLAFFKGVGGGLARHQ